MSYTPDSGDLVWLEPKADAHTGQLARSVLVITPKPYYQKTGLAICCPVTLDVKGYPFEVLISEEKSNGAILVDRMKNIDMKGYNVKFIEKVSATIMDECVAKISALLIQRGR